MVPGILGFQGEQSQRDIISEPKAWPEKLGCESMGGRFEDSSSFWEGNDLGKKQAMLYDVIYIYIFRCIY